MEMMTEAELHRNEVARPRTLQIAGGIIRYVERAIAVTARDGDDHFFDTGLFPWVSEVEKALPKMLPELMALLEQLDEVPPFEEVSHDQVKLTNDGRWKTYFFRGYGIDFKENCRKCPETWAALNHIPDLTSAFFSILEPNKRIPPHRGPYKGVLRYHLAMIVPADETKAWINVGGTVRNWHQGRSLIFDDSFVHSAANDSEQIRVVLFADFVRPLRFPMNMVNRLILAIIKKSSYVREAKQNYDEWTQAFQKKLKDSRAGPIND